jgi:hypothetical protein
MANRSQRKKRLTQVYENVSTNLLLNLPDLVNSSFPTVKMKSMNHNMEKEQSRTKYKF